MKKSSYNISILFCFLFVIGFYQESKSYKEPSNNTISENIYFKNRKDDITLAGTLSLPSKRGRFPAVILISGNGRNNRDEEFGRHKPFLDISNYLTRNGFAVFRFDKRGVGESEGDFDSASSFDFAEDVRAALNYLLTRKEIQQNNIGLIGHSEGGLIAPIVAASSLNVAFIVSLAGPSLSGDKILLSQQKALAKKRGLNDSIIENSQKANRGAFDIVKHYTNDLVLKSKMVEYIQGISYNDPDKPKGMTFDEYINAQVKSILNPWMINFLRFKPEDYIRYVKCPVLALNGSKDLQVLAKENLPEWKRILEESGNTSVTIKELPNINHLFQTSNTGLPEEYKKINESFSIIAMKEMTSWMKIHIK
ncbi:alpha/beta hydrolase family protein [Pedobacter mendelii]|uniref:alpha/beta hydrolase family protein n=1 Tax=Pedobacter mendelii TaxID=1908240 RepID=UPI003605D2A2